MYTIARNTHAAANSNNSGERSYSFKDCCITLCFWARKCYISSRWKYSLDGLKSGSIWSLILNETKIFQTEYNLALSSTCPHNIKRNYNDKLRYWNSYQTQHCSPQLTLANRGQMWYYCVFLCEQKMNLGAGVWMVVEYKGEYVIFSLGNYVEPQDTWIYLSPYQSEFL